MDKEADTLEAKYGLLAQKYAIVKRALTEVSCSHLSFPRKYCLLGSKSTERSRKQSQGAQRQVVRL